MEFVQASGKLPVLATYPTQEDVDAYAQRHGAHQRDEFARRSHVWSHSALMTVVVLTVSVSFNRRAFQMLSRLFSDDVPLTLQGFCSRLAD